MYARGDALTDFERKKLFGTTTMEQRMALPTDRQKEWLNSMRDLMPTAQRHDRQAPAGNSDIRSFFTPATHRLGTHSGRPPGATDSST
eukprot:scaffold16330_cov102-Cylindrotheca_fusiformis.AAC.2